MTIHLIEDVAVASCKVAVYWNLSRRVWSIKLDERVGALAKGKVVAWADAEHAFALTGVTFHVSVQQHRTALAGTGARGTKRNVVAWVCGKLADSEQVIAGRRVSFHWPDARSTFHCVDNGAPIRNADAAVFTTVDGAGKVFV